MEGKTPVASSDWASDAPSSTDLHASTAIFRTLHTKLESGFTLLHYPKTHVWKLCDREELHINRPQINFEKSRNLTSASRQVQTKNSSTNVCISFLFFKTAINFVALKKSPVRFLTT